MSAPRPPLETVRGFVEGRLSPAEREAFATQMAADRATADLVAAYGEVHAATLDPAPACPVTAETLRLDAAPAPTPVLSLLRRAAPFAAAVLVVAGAAFALSRGTPPDPTTQPERGPLALRAIREAGPQDVPPEPPAILSRYTPATDGRLAFLADLDEAREAARAAGRPLLIFVSLEMCPICRDMEAHAFREEDVIRAANGFVLVTLDPSRPEAEGLTRGIDFSKSWPAFVVEDASGVVRRAHGFPLPVNRPMPTAADVATELKAAYEALPASDRAGPLPWDDVHAATRALRSADDEADPAARVAAWALASGKDPKGPLGARARALWADDAKGARDALEAARALAAKDGAKAAVARLDGDLPRFAGSPYAADLRAVRDRLARDDAFPDVVFAR